MFKQEKSKRKVKLGQNAKNYAILSSRKTKDYICSLVSFKDYYEEPYAKKTHVRFREGR